MIVREGYKVCFDPFDIGLGPNNLCCGKIKYVNVPTYDVSKIGPRSLLRRGNHATFSHNGFLHMEESVFKDNENRCLKMKRDDLIDWHKEAIKPKNTRYCEEYDLFVSANYPNERSNVNLEPEKRKKMRDEDEDAKYIPILLENLRNLIRLLPEDIRGPIVCLLSKNLRTEVAAKFLGVSPQYVSNSRNIDTSVLNRI